MCKLINRALQWPVDRWIALSAVVISSCALIASIDQAYRIRLHQRLSVRPYIGLSFNHNEEGAGWIMTNQGLGPAFVRWFSVTVDGIRHPHWEGVRAALGLPSPTDFTFVAPSPATVVPPNIPWKIFWAEPGPSAPILVRNYNRLLIEICYCSFYGECELKTSEIDRPVRNSCKAGPAPPFTAGPIP